MLAALLLHALLVHSSGIWRVSSAVYTTPKLEDESACGWVTSMTLAEQRVRKISRDIRLGQKQADEPAIVGTASAAQHAATTNATVLLFSFSRAFFYWLQ